MTTLSEGGNVLDTIDASSSTSELDKLKSDIATAIKLIENSVSQTLNTKWFIFFRLQNEVFVGKDEVKYDFDQDVCRDLFSKKKDILLNEIERIAKIYLLKIEIDFKKRKLRIQRIS